MLTIQNSIILIYRRMKKSHCFRTKHAIEAYSATRDLWDTPVFESRSFVVLPTVGALVEGWLLVVPKTPALSFAHLSTSQFSELDCFLRDIVPVIESNYGPVSVFEHGPASRGSTVGCGVDYAHLHLVPTLCDLHTGAREIAPNVQWDELRSIEEIRRCATLTDGYWFLQQAYASSQCYVGRCTYGKPTSQLFRKVIAKHLGCPSAYDWKSGSGEAMIAATVANLAHRSLLA